ncbi:MAG: hypothetical protein N2745_03260 [Syntrophorhabdaceae bacterium]|nr:hypothetical protein [Syntrophorhabdaceae bacterium]
MEEKVLVQDFQEMFRDIEEILDILWKGFINNKDSNIKEAKKRFYEGVKTRLSFAERLVEKKDKDEVEKKYVTLLLSFQQILLAVENLINRVQSKVESNVLFSKKAVDETKDVYEIIKAIMKDGRDYIITKNSLLKKSVDDNREKLINTITDYEIVHQNRLITGICMPKASYLYIEVMDSMKRLARGVMDFISKM